MKKNQLNYFYVAGVDEVGRGPLCGPVITAAVILHPNYNIVGLNDSKKLSEKKRECLFHTITQHALAWSIGRAEVNEIDRLNILQATMLAMQRAVLALAIKPSLVLIDGNRCPELPYPSQAIVKGDGKEPAIAAASILAKVTRDKEMLQLHQQFPEYDFAKNKGYPTAQHLEAIQKHGILNIHRRSFKPVKQYLEEYTT